MVFLDGLEKLINEHGSAVILKERINLANDKYAALEQKVVTLEQKIVALEAEKSAIQGALDEAQKEIKNLKKLTEKVHSNRLEEVREKIIVFLASNDGATDQQIAQHIDIGEQVASFHLQELEAIRFARRTLRVGQRFTPWHVTQESRRYLVAHGLIS